ncbi:DUF393 domain-containing protein [Comamonadaceae bacterium M7527]|nr:DUF393 domain-containing protein [Comamonadaceae bacterium M7527]
MPLNRHTAARLLGLGYNCSMTTKPTTGTNQQSADRGALTVMFDGACPLCRREIGLYQSLKPLQPVCWQDVSKGGDDITPQQQAQYMARFHVRLPNGELLSGATAFVALWHSMPGWRWLARLASLPGVTPMLELAYKGFLRIRPALQRLMR